MRKYAATGKQSKKGHPPRERERMETKKADAEDKARAQRMLAEFDWLKEKTKQPKDRKMARSPN
jgi:hypothetical protein